MIEQTVAALFVAALTGITYIAYKHPAAYRKLYIPTMFAYIFIQVALTGYEIGLSRAFKTLKPHIDQEKLAEATAASDNLELLTSGVIFPSSVLVFYLAFLYCLPRIIGDDRKP